MQLDLARYRDESRSLMRWSTGLLVSAGVIGTFGSVFVVLGVLIALYPRSIPSHDLWITLGALAALGIIPCGIAIAIAVPGWRRHRRHQRLRMLAALVRLQGRPSDDEIEKTLRIDRRERERLLKDSKEKGVIQEP